MCILFVYTNPDPEDGKYQLVIATNRDEYFVRPASAAHHWPENEKIIAGKDLEPGREGGTWFGISLLKTREFTFRAGALLNVTGEPKQSDAAGRGCIVTDYLKSDLTAEEYIIQKLKPMQISSKTYNAFMFVAVELTENVPRLVYYTNVNDSRMVIADSAKFISGFGNSLIHEPLAKVTAGKHKFEYDVNACNGETLVEKLVEFLKCEEKFLPDPVLQRRAPGMEEHLSKVFVNVEEAGYGTRTHSVVLVDHQGNVDFVEDTLLEGKWFKNEFQARL